MDQPITEKCWEVAHIDVSRSQRGNRDAEHHYLEQKREMVPNFLFLDLNSYMVACYDLAILTSEEHKDS